MLGVQKFFFKSIRFDGGGDDDDNDDDDDDDDDGAVMPSSCQRMPYTCIRVLPTTSMLSVTHIWPSIGNSGDNVHDVTPGVAWRLPHLQDIPRHDRWKPQ